jgi:hypothetical protein
MRSITETNLDTGAVLVWSDKIRDAWKNRTPLPSLVDRSPFGSLFTKDVRFTGVGEDRVLVEVVVYRKDDKGDVIAGTEQSIEEPDVLVGQQITDAHIKIGSTVLSWQPM